MSYWQNFLQNLDLSAVRQLAIRVLAALICIILHECAHGFAAERMGDHTARDSGRLSWNPIRHIDAFGLLMMVVAGVGWAKPVPVNPNNFRHPKRGMALTALAGPASNFIFAIICLWVGKFILNIGYRIDTNLAIAVWLFVFQLVLRMATLNVGLALFNLIPIPPLDGAKVLFSFLPENLYFKAMKYERYIMVALFLLIAVGDVFDQPLNWSIHLVLKGMCTVTGFPSDILGL